jgi:excisionase family DNA binding protein
VADTIQSPLVPIAEAAKVLHCHPDTIYNMEKRGQIRLLRPFRRTMVPKSELDRIIAGEPIQASVGGPVVEPSPMRVKKRKLYPMLVE